MVTSVIATKLGMTQAWTTSGKRLPVTRVRAEAQRVLSVADTTVTVGYGDRAMKRLNKPIQGILKKANVETGVKKLMTVKLAADQATDSVTAGQTIVLSNELSVGDVVQVQGTSRGRGFAGVVKRYGFHGGPATHGQSDRHRAPGSIGMRTTPGRVFRNKRMAGHMGDETKTVLGLVVVHIDPATNEIWLSGPVPGTAESILKITKTGAKKEIQLDKVASHLPVETVKETEVAENQSESTESEVVAAEQVS